MTLITPASMNKIHTEVTTPPPKRPAVDACKSCLAHIISIKLALVFIFLLLIVVVCTAWGVIINSVQYESSMTLSGSFRNEVIKSVKNYLDSILNPLPVLAKSIANTLSTSLVDWYGPKEPVDRMMWNQHMANQHITAIYFATENTQSSVSYMYLGDIEAHGSSWPGMLEPGLGYITPILDHDTFGAYNLSEAPFIIPLADVTVDLFWYSKAIKAGNLGWSEPYWDAMFPTQIWISAFAKITNYTTNERIGYVGVDYSLQDISKYMVESIRVSETGFAYIMELNGNLVASSNNHEMLVMVNDEGQKINVTSITDNQLFPASANAIFTKHGGDLSSVPDSVIQITVGDQTAPVLVQYTRYHDKLGLNFIIVVVAPESEFLAPLYLMRTILAITAVSTIVVALAVGIIVALCITIPLSTLGREMNKITKLDIANAKVTKSLFRFQEVSSLQTKFNRMRNALVSFGKYIPLDVVRSLLAEGREALIGLEECNISLFFSDIEGFTSISEMLRPDQLVTLVETYFSHCTGIILQQEGTIDKYIGDAIFAFWNAPKNVKEHQYKALKSAVLIQKKMKELESTWESAGLPIVRTRIGLNTGHALVGNMGSMYRINYTAIGDNVNLAARLEAINKDYGTHICISEQMYDEVGTQFLCRPLDKVAVVGKSQAIMIYEAAKDIMDATEADKKAYSTFTLGFKQYLNRNFTEAINLFQEFLQYHPKDKAAMLLTSRCSEFITSPPPSTWDGTTVKTTK